MRFPLGPMISRSGPCSCVFDCCPKPAAFAQRRSAIANVFLMSDLLEPVKLDVFERTYAMPWMCSMQWRRNHPAAIREKLRATLFNPFTVCGAHKTQKPLGRGGTKVSIYL